MQQEKNWSEYWQQEGVSGEVFVNKDGNKHPELEKFWCDSINRINAKSIIDIASGGGAIFSTLEQPEQYELLATDISAEALKTQQQRIPHVQTLVCDATEVPVEDHQYDLVVSQFGIEYAGTDAFAEAARLLKPSGAIEFLCHIEDGYIDARNKAELVGAQLCQQTQFVTRASALVRAMDENNEALTRQAFDAFTQVEPKLAAYVSKVTRGVHVHLYNGFKQLMTQRHKYDSKDILDWLTGMQAEVDKSLTRLTEMRSAALNKDAITTIKQHFSAAGLSDISAKPYYLTGYTLPVAWHISAIRN